MNKTPYEKADLELKAILKKIKNSFRKHRLKSFLPFDEINALKLKKSVKKLYARIEKLNGKFYNAVAEEAYQAAQKEIGANEKEFDPIMLLPLFSEVNRVTGYVYENELERKRDRFYESLLALLANGYTEAEIISAYDKALRYLQQQTEQYEIEIVDFMRRQAFEENGVERYRWITQRDGHVCKYCKELDGEVFPADGIPARHYRCRCYLVEAT